MASVSEYILQFWAARGFWLTIGVILVALPVIYEISEEEMPQSASRCLHILIVMAIVWLSEALPIAATALFPMVMFPLAGVMTAKETSASYLTDTSMLFLGGLIVAVAVEEWNLHRRIAILVMMLVGADPKWIMAGMMIPTWFLSMWISNTATASMMIPIAQAVLEQIFTTNEEDKTEYIVPNLQDASDEQIQLEDANTTSGDSKPLPDTKEGIMNPIFVGDAPDGTNVPVSDEPNGRAHTHQVTDEDKADKPDKSSSGGAHSSRLSKGITLCIAYSSNIGGIATLTGTPPNLVLKGIADELYKDYQKRNGTAEIGSPISFSNWMILAFPLSAIILVLGWLLLVIFFISGKGCCTVNKSQALAIKRVMREEWRKLGPITMAEIEVLVLFVFLAVMWISRDPKESPGWHSWFIAGYVSDSTCAMLIAVLLFILPAKIPNILCWHTDERAKEPYWTPLLTWKQVNHKLPWGVIILLGGGFALAKGVQRSHLDEWLASKLESLDNLDTWVLNLVLCLIVAAATEVTSNTATATLLMPILANLAISLGVNPLYLMVSSALATSFAFMLPVATPPNAIVFSYGAIKVFDMAKAGIFMNIIAIAALSLAVNTWGKPVYDFDTIDPIFVS